MNLFSQGRNVAECWNYHSCGISSVDGLTTILEVNEGHDDTRPDSLVVWLLLHLTHEFKQAFAQGDEIRLRQAHRSPHEGDLPALPGFLGDTRRGDVGSGGLKHGTEKLSVLQRAKYNHITFAAFSMLDEQLTFRRSYVIVLRKLDTKERKSHLIPKFTE